MARGAIARGQESAGATSTKQELNGAAPAGEVRSAVSTLAQPRVSVPEGSGVYQAPSLIETTPGAMRSVTRAGSRVSPRACDGSDRKSTRLNSSHDQIS